MVKLSDFELGWLVGLLEGEAHFQYNGCSQYIQLYMTDQDTIVSVIKIVEKVIACPIKMSYREADGKRTKQVQYGFTITGVRARTVMQLIAPYMHYRRRARIWQILNKYKEKKVKLADVGLSVAQLIGNIKENC